jgi:hypothetical protein
MRMRMPVMRARSRLEQHLELVHMVKNVINMNLMFMG